MKLLLEFKAEMAGGTVFRTRVATPDLVAFERKYDRRAADILNGREEWLAFCIHHALRRNGISVPEDFDAFLGELEAINWSAPDSDTATPEGESADDPKAPPAMQQVGHSRPEPAVSSLT